MHTYRIDNHYRHRSSMHNGSRWHMQTITSNHNTYMATLLAVYRALVRHNTC